MLAKLGLESNERGIFLTGSASLQTLARQVQTDSESPRDQAALLEWLETLLDTENGLKFALSPLKAEGSSDDDYANIKSLFRILLDTEKLQPRIVSTFLERVSLLVATGFNPLDPVSESEPRLLLQSLKWCDIRPASAELYTEKIMDLLHLSCFEYQREVILSLPDIISDSQHKDVAEALCELMNSNGDLLAASLEALSNFSVDEKTMDVVRESLLSRIQSAEPCEIPPILRFLFHTASSGTIEKIIESVRTGLDLKSLQTADSLSDQVIPLIIDAIRTGFRFTKILVDGWLKILSHVEAEKSLKSLDLFVLLMVHGMNTTTRKKIELLFKTKIDKGVLKPQFLELSIRGHADIAKEHSKQLLEVAEYLLKASSAKDVAMMIPAAKAIYESLFSCCSAYMKQEIISSLVAHSSNGCASETTGALKIFLRLIEANQQEPFERYGATIKCLLDYVEDFSLDHIRDVYSILSGIALQDYNSRSGIQSSFADEIYIVIRKELSHPLEKFKFMGIIGAVSFIKILSGKGDSSKYCIELLDLITRCIADFPACQSLFYDELAVVILAGALDPVLMEHIVDKIAMQLQDFFVTLKQNVAGSQEATGLEYEVWMDASEEDEEAIAIKVLPSCFEGMMLSQGGKKSSVALLKSRIHVLAPLLHLLQATDCISEEPLQAIDALLSCGIVLYKKSVDFEFLSQDALKALVVALFHAVNWFRELINTFSKVPNNAPFQKLCNLRCEHILSLEEFLESALQRLPVSALPELISNDAIVAYVQGLSKPVKASSKHHEAAPDSDQENIIDTRSMADATGKAKAKFQTLTLENVKPWMREFSLTFYNLLSYKEQKSCTGGYSLSSGALLYVLTDLFQKTEIKFNPNYVLPFTVARRKRDPKHVELKKFALVTPEAFFQNLFESALPSLLERLVAFKESLINQVQDDGAIDLDMNADLLQSGVLISKIFENVLAWLANITDQSHFKQFLRLFADNLSECGAFDSSNYLHLLEGAFNFFGSFGNSWPTAQGAIAFLKIQSKLLVILKHTPNVNDDQICIWRASISSSCATFLATEWSDRPTLKEAQISWIFSELVAQSESAHEILSKFALQILPSLFTEDFAALEQCVFLTKDSFSLFYKLVMEKLSDGIKSQLGTVKASHEEELEILYAYAKCFAQMIGIVKTVDKREILAHSMKYGKNFVDNFTKHCPPIFDRHMNEDRTILLSTVRVFQNATRNLQNICGHLKEGRDQKLTTYVPLVKKSLELFIYAVRAVFSKHNASAAFSIGNLRHRNLQGEILSSQMPASPEKSQPAATAAATKKRRAPTQKGPKNAKKKEAQPVESDLSASVVQDSDDEEDRASVSLNEPEEESQDLGELLHLSQVDEEDEHDEGETLEME